MIIAMVQALNDRNSGLLVFMLVFMTLAVTKTKQQDSFYFDPSPINQDVVEGLEALLRCDVSNRRQIQFYWTLNGRQLVNTSRRYQDGTNLRILRVDRVHDAGSFRCIATNVTTGIALRSTEAKLNISWINSTVLVELTKPDSVAEIADGVEINFRCHANGNPDPVIEWYRNRIKLFVSNRIRIAKNKTRLIGVSSTDNGVYSCRASNPAGTANSIDNFLLTVPGSDVPSLEVASFTQVQLVKSQRSAVFHCRYLNAVSTEWYFDQKRVENDGDKYTVHGNGTLVINRVERQDAGVYNCVGLNSKGAAQTYAAELQLASLDELTDDSFEPKPSNPQVIPLGGKLEIRCLMPKGNPSPTLRWEDPYNVEIVDQGRVKGSDGLLAITGAVESDTGNYTCRVSNLDGTRSRAVWIVISVPPRLKSPPLSNRRTEGESVNFDCNVIGTPYPVTLVTWTKDEQPLDMSNPDRMSVDPHSGTLRINGITMGDEGNYACTVNTVGHPPVVSSNAHLYVESSLKFKPMLLNQKLELGANATIRCRADGQFPPRVRWSKIGLSELSNHVHDLDGSLQFTRVLSTDAGEYMCTASSEQGIINVTVRIDVVVRPKFKVKPINTTAYEGHPTMLHCIATGDPEPAVQWDKNNKILVLDEHEQRLKILSNGSLHITVAYIEDSGKYGCTAGNSGGLEREEVFLQVASGDSFGRFTDAGNSADNFNMMKTIIIAVCSAVAYLAIVIGLTVYCSIRLMRAKNQRKQRTSEGAANGTEKGENGLIALETTELVDKSKDSLIGKNDLDAFSLSVAGSHNSHSTHSRTSQRNYDKWAFPRKDLDTLGMLGKGYYGDVFLAKAYGVNGGLPERLVVVKSLMSRSELHLAEFYHEVDLFGRVNHDHVARLIGVCREVEPMFVITEYCEWGDLKQFLLALRKEITSGQNGIGPALGGGPFSPSVRLPTLTVAQQLTMCHQISIGMEQLANQRLVHRDLAARNILLTPSLDVKIASLGLSRDVYSAEYAPWRNRLVPIRWTAPEVFGACPDVSMTSSDAIGDHGDAESGYTSSSDVFSFGVFVWELFALGDLPLRHLSDDDVIRCRKQVAGGPAAAAVRLPFAPACPLDLWQLVERCQADFPGDRPTFAELSAGIGEMIAAIIV